MYNASAKFYCVSFFYHMYGKHIGELGDQTVCPSIVRAGRREGGHGRLALAGERPGLPHLAGSHILGGGVASIWVREEASLRF